MYQEPTFVEKMMDYAKENKKSIAVALTVLGIAAFYGFLKQSNKK